MICNFLNKIFGQTPKSQPSLTFINLKCYYIVSGLTPVGSLPTWQKGVAQLTKMRWIGQHFVAKIKYGATDNNEEEPNNYLRSNKGLSKEERQRRCREIQNYRRNRQMAAACKSHSIRVESFDEFAQLWLNEVERQELLARAGELATISIEEHAVFANTYSAAELESSARVTVVGIGPYADLGLMMVYNRKKNGLGFPGGRVRHGQTDTVRLVMEIDQETGMKAEVLSDKQISSFLVGEEEHEFRVYEVKYTGGTPMARPTKEEPITVVAFVPEEVLKAACLTGGRIQVQGLKQPVAVLRSHRKGFLDYLNRRQQAQEVTIV